MSLHSRSKSELAQVLEENYRRFSTTDFIPNDPISIPHRFSQQQDIEIAAFFAAILAWGNRKSIIKSVNRIMNLMDEAPYAFIKGHHEKDLKPFEKFVHRTFNADDLLGIVSCLKQAYDHTPSLESFFLSTEGHEEGLRKFPELFLKGPVLQRTHKHIARVDKGSAAKRLNMFLRWMVRNDESGIDFGLWKKISPADLFIPLDVHTARVARSLNLLSRNQNDWRAVLELTEKLREFDPYDPVRFDYALFGLGVSGKPIT